MAIELEHPAYDCVYLALALNNEWQFTTADDRLRRKFDEPGVENRLKNVVVSMADAASRR